MEEEVLTAHDLLSRAEQAMPPGESWPNPRRGITKIKGYRNGKVSYIHGKSVISVSFTDLFAAYSEFRGKEVTSRDLRGYAPHVFDSNARPAGHSCNCTFLFGMLTRLKLADGLRGEGKSNRPFYTTFL